MIDDELYLIQCRDLLFWVVGAFEVGREGGVQLGHVLGFIVRYLDHHFLGA
jgi:hypothetical protein